MKKFKLEYLWPQSLRLFLLILSTKIIKNFKKLEYLWYKAFRYFFGNPGVVIMVFIGIFIILGYILIPPNSNEQLSILVRISMVLSLFAWGFIAAVIIIFTVILVVIKALVKRKKLKYVWNEVFSMKTPDFSTKTKKIIS